MKTVRFDVAGNNSLADINEILSYQECLNSEFLDSRIAYLHEEVLNLVTFNLYDDATLPGELILKEKDSDPPLDATKFWEGVMVVNNQLAVVLAYRKKG